MPLTIESGALDEAEPRSGSRERRSRRGAPSDRGKRIVVGFVNNMPDAAVASTERQFARLLDEASGDFDLRLRRYRLETLPRSAEAAQAIAATHREVRTLSPGSLDALIVTGAEPRAATLPQEPYWNELAAVVDFARSRTLSSVFSCLAAHAAVLKLDEIPRVPLSRKMSGVFEIEVVHADPLVRGLERGALVPHSRHNTVDEAHLVAKGYQVLTRAGAAGPDIFVKPDASKLIFIQGHPEYDTDTLSKEFRRDTERFLSGRIATAPMPPQRYFMPETEVELLALARRRARGEEVDPSELKEQPRPRFSDPPPWRLTGVTLYRNWLALIAARKKSPLEMPLFARWGG